MREPPTNNNRIISAIETKNENLNTNKENNNNDNMNNVN